MKKNLIAGLAVVCAALSFSSCDQIDYGYSSTNEIGPKKTLADSICGEWYSKTSFGYSIVTYNEDGSCKDWTPVFVDGFSVNEHADGTWSLEGSSLRSSITMELLGQINSTVTVNKVTDFNLTCESATDGISTSSRIVNEMTIKAGETSKIELSKPYNKLVPTSYDSDYKWVASVDNEGNVTGKNAGTTYVMVADNNGNSVVVKVNVISEQILPDFTGCIGQNIAEATQDFDKEIGFFTHNGVGMWDIYTVAVRDGDISKIEFATLKGSEEVCMISMELSEAADLDAIHKMFAAKYHSFPADLGTYYLDGDIETAEHKIFIDNAYRSITISANNQQNDDSLVPDYSSMDQMNIDQFLNTFNLAIDEDELDPDEEDQLVYIFPSNPAVSYGFISFNMSTGVISSISLYMDTDATSEEEVNAYLESIYSKQVVGTNVYYCTSESLLTSNVWISCKVNSRGKLVVTFMNRAALM